MPAPPPERTKPTAAQLVLLSGLMVAFGLFVSATAKVLLILFAGALLGLWLRAFAELIARFIHFKAGATLILLVAFGLCLLGTIVVMGAPRWAEQVSQLNRQLSAAIDQVSAYWQRTPIIGRAASALRGYTNTLVGAALSAAGTSVQIVEGLVILVFIGIYGAAQPNAYVRVALVLTPRPYRQRIRRVLRQLRTDLVRWFLTRLAAMAFVGTAATLCFYLLDVPLALLLGLLAGLLTFIEYLGAIISAIPPLLLALASSPITALWVLILFTGLHVVEGYLITPLLVRNAVRFPPAITLGGQALFAVLLGPLGLAFSTPLLVAAAAVAKGWRVD
jgi:predicted PurR-regulated permease PerM